MAASSLPKTKTWLMFDRIAPRYDLLNRLLSMYQDVRWRKRLTKHFPDRKEIFLIDLATGTADIPLMLRSRNPKITKAIGFDMAEKMLEVGREKIRDQSQDQIIELRTGDATQIPLDGYQADVVTIAFGIRNVENVRRCLQEMLRILKPGGRCLILEFSLPRNTLLKNLYLFYFRNILPLIGGWISGDREAYRYLNTSVEDFPYGDAFVRLMEAEGFSEVQCHPLTFGIASIYQGDKPL